MRNTKKQVFFWKIGVVILQTFTLLTWYKSLIDPITFINKRHEMKDLVSIALSYSILALICYVAQIALLIWISKSLSSFWRFFFILIAILTGLVLFGIFV